MTDEKDLPESHRQQIAEGTKKALLRSGIRPALHNTGFGDLIGGKQIAEWLGAGGGFASLVKQGLPWLIETTTADSHIVMPVMTRALILTGSNAKVVWLTDLIRAIEARDYEQFDEYREGSTLLIHGFFEAGSSRDDRPFNAYQKRQIQDLILDRMAGGAGVALHISNTAGKRYQLTDWWDQSLVAALGSERILKVTKP